MARQSAARTKRQDRDAEATREDILEAATEEFADKGLSGARIDKIAVTFEQRRDQRDRDEVERDEIEAELFDPDE